jgi:homoserine acetyltransferase
LLEILLEFLLKGYVLKIDTLFALIGGSVGGGIAWEILALEPKLAQNFIPSLQIGKRLTG